MPVMQLRYVNILAGPQQLMLKVTILAKCKHKAMTSKRRYVIVSQNKLERASKPSSEEWVTGHSFQPSCITWQSLGVGVRAFNGSSKFKNQIYYNLSQHIHEKVPHTPFVFSPLPSHPCFLIIILIRLIPTSLLILQQPKGYNCSLDRISVLIALTQMCRLSGRNY